MTLNPVQPTELATREVRQVFWLCGVLDRLTGLGFLEGGAQLRLTAESADLFEEIDSVCECLFDNDEELAAVLDLVFASELEEGLLAQVLHLVISYRDNRVEMTRFALTLRFSA
jgi:hypothetical protein